MTTGQRRVLGALALLTEDGWPASTREIAEVAGYRSASTTHRILNQLVRDGHARKGPRPRHGWLLNARTTEF